MENGSAHFPEDEVTPPLPTDQASLWKIWLKIHAAQEEVRKAWTPALKRLANTERTAWVAFGISLAALLVAVVALATR